MTKRAARLLLIAMLAALVAASAAAVWLLTTESGARWAFARVEAVTDGRVRAASLAGTLTGGLTLTGLVYRDATQRVTVERALLDVDPDLFPTRLDVEALELESVTLESTGDTPAPGDGEPFAIDALLPALQLPFPVRVEDGRVRRLARILPDGSRRELLSSLDVAGRLFETLEIERLALSAPGLSLEARGGLELDAPFELAPGTRLSVASSGAARLVASAGLAGSLENLELDIRGDAPSFAVRGTVQATAPDPRFDLEADAPRLAWPLRGDAPVVVLEDVSLKARGRLSDYGFDAGASVGVDGFRAAEVSARGRGDSRHLAIDALEVSSDEVAGTVRGELAWSPGFAVDAEADVTRLDPARWIDDWPAPSTVSGRLAGAFEDGRLELGTIELAHDASQAELAGHGLVDLGGGVVDGELSWQNLQWPLGPATANVESRAGRLAVSGTPEDWSLAGEVTLGAPELPDGRFRIDGGGDRDGLELEIADSEVLGGRVTGALAFSWRERRPWSASLAATEVEVTPLLPEWPGRLSAQFTASGRQQPFELSVDIAGLAGRLRGRPVAARGGLAVDGGRVRADGLEVTSGGSRVSLDGSYRGAEGLTFAADVASLADFVPGVAGAVRGRGNLAARPGLPRVEGELGAEGLRFGAFEIGTLSVANAPAADAPLGITAEARDLTIAGNPVDRISLTLAGEPARHRAELEAGAGASVARMALEGGAELEEPLAASRWEGRVVDAAVEDGEGLSLALRAPAALALSARQASLERACLEGAGALAVCGAGDWSADGAFASVIDLTEVPVDLVNAVVPGELGFSQTLSGTVEASRPAGGRLSAGGRIDLSPGQIRNTQDDRLSMRTRAGFARFELDDGSLLSAELELPFSDGAELAGEFRVVDVARGPSSPIEGRLRANIRDIAMGANIVPSIDEAGGHLLADIRIDGSVERPRFGGTASLENGLIAYDPLGVRLDDIQLESEIREGNRIELRGSFRAGQGRGEITTSADYLQGRQAALELSIAGSSMTLIDVPDLSVTVDTDLAVRLHDDDVTIGGRVTVPRARLSSVQFTQQSVTESPDVEFVDDRPDAGDAQAARSALNFGGSVELALGEDVVIDVDVAQARLNGSSTFTWQGPALPRASGQYGVRGKFEAYGQLLEITEGSIRYPDVPANQPELRIRAEREIFGNSEIRRAGVLVTGTATRPSFEVYTTPATNEDRALTLLVTGSDFDYEQGVGSVDVGTYIAPRLYASYGIGLFDRENVVSVRYDLTKAFGIKATSGKRASGIDISYTIEH